MPSDMNSRAFAEEVDTLLVELEMALEDLSEDLEDLTPLDMACRVLHTLSGAGGMFGFGRMAAFACEVEAEVSKVRRGDVTVTQEFLARVRESCGRIRLLMGEQSGETGASLVSEGGASGPGEV